MLFSTEATLIVTKSKKTKPRTYLLPSLLTLMALTEFVAYRYFLQAPYSFRDDFNSNSVEELRNQAWNFIHFDSSWFYPQDSGVLTLRYARGDYWVRPYETPYINNVVYRELPKG